MICVSLSGLGELRKLSPEVEMVELRLDLIGTTPEEVYALLPPGISSIATCRPGSMPDTTRISWLKSAMDLGASRVDVELESEEAFLQELRGYAGEKGVELIVSCHYFEGTPALEELSTQFQRCFDRGGDIAKVATLIRSREDLVDLLSLYRLPGRKVILGMGPLGRVSRIVAPYLGSEFTFASPGTGMETAPGQLDFEQLTEIYQVINQS